VLAALKEQGIAANVSVPTQVVEVQAPAPVAEPVRATPKLELAIQYLKDNPDAMNMSQRKLAELDIEGGNISHPIWGKAKKALR
jgi:hypothetical protein